jgi:hypothetical protein
MAGSSRDETGRSDGGMVVAGEGADVGGRVTGTSRVGEVDRGTGGLVVAGATVFVGSRGAVGGADVGVVGDAPSKPLWCHPFAARCEGTLAPAPHTT